MRVLKRGRAKGLFNPFKEIEILALPNSKRAIGDDIRRARGGGREWSGRGGWVKRPEKKRTRE